MYSQFISMFKKHVLSQCGPIRSVQCGYSLDQETRIFNVFSVYLNPGLLEVQCGYSLDQETHFFHVFPIYLTMGVLKVKMCLLKRNLFFMYF